MKMEVNCYAQIELNGISKIFKVSKRPEGHFGILRGAFSRETTVVKALEDLTFQIDEGELVGYIGPNGAGKSTTVKVMSGILTPELGNCTIMNRTPWKERIDITSLLKTPVRQLSLGQRMRCEIAAALLHNPKILFLDEPTIGLDAVSKLALREFLKNENRKNGITMILTTHDMDDIESLCNRVMVIGHGKLLYDGKLSMLKEQYSSYRRISATLHRNVNEFPIENVESVNIEGNTWTIIFNPLKITPYTLIEHLVKKLPIYMCNTS